MHKILPFLTLMIAGYYCVAQQVQTYATTTLDGPDGIVVDSKGVIYVANWGKTGMGTVVTRVDPGGKETVFLDGLASPDGLTFDGDDNLLVSCFRSGEVLKIGLNKSRTALASGLDHPSDIKFDAKGDLYVSSFGNYNGTKVFKIKSDGTQSIFVDSLSVPLGLVFDKYQNLYISNFGSGAIYVVDKTGKKSLYAQLPNSPAGYFQYLAFDDNGTLYCPSYAHNCIYKIDAQKSISKMTLTNEKNLPVALDGPNSIFIKDGYLYFTEFNAGRLSRVKLN